MQFRKTGVDSALVGVLESIFNRGNEVLMVGFSSSVGSRFPIGGVRGLNYITSRVRGVDGALLPAISLRTLLYASLLAGYALIAIQAWRYPNCRPGKPKYHFVKLGGLMES